MKRNQVWKGQRWRNKATGRFVTIMGKSSGNLHWNVDNGHRIHEGTLLKYYEAVEPARRTG